MYRAVARYSTKLSFSVTLLIYLGAVAGAMGRLKATLLPVYYLTTYANQELNLGRRMLGGPGYTRPPPKSLDSPLPMGEEHRSVNP